MGTFAVKIGNAEYEVDAPDEKTAWKYANAEHSKPYDIPAGLKSLMNVGQGVSFGFGDEIAGALGADKNRYRATLEDFQNEYPKSAMLGGISGSMLLPFGLGRLSTTPLQTAAVTGAISGALQGAGDAPTMDDVQKDAARAGGIGLAFGPLAFGMTKPVGGAMSALMTKAPIVGDDFAKSLARNRVVQSFGRDSIDVAGVESNLARLGGEARIADAAGENTRGLLDLNANLPGKTKDRLESLIRNRIATRPERMDDMVYSVNDGYGRAGNLESALTKQQQATSAPLYRQAHAMDVTPSPQLVNDLEAARKLGAFSEAEKRALANPEIGPFTLSASQQKLGEGRISVRDLDHIKQGIDSLIEGQTDSVTGKVTAYGRDLLKLKQRIVSEVDSATTDPQTGISIYKAARDAYAGPASLKNAINKGRSFWNESAESLSAQMSGMSESEKQAFRVGAAEALRTMSGSQTGQNRLLNMWKDRNTREKMQELLGSDVKFSEVQKLLSGEETLRRLEGLGPSRNSRTFSREAASDDQSLAIAQDALSSAATGSMRPLMQAAAKNWGRLTTPEPVRDAIGEILMKQYAPAEMKALMEAQEVMRRHQKTISSLSGVAAGKTSSKK